MRNTAHDNATSLEAVEMPRLVTSSKFHALPIKPQNLLANGIRETKYQDSCRMVRQSNNDETEGNFHAHTYGSKDMQAYTSAWLTDSVGRFSKRAPIAIALQNAQVDGAEALQPSSPSECS